MIEVLITLFILAIGLLGVASLQFVGSFSNADALNRTQSVLVAQQVSERLRANAVTSLTGDGLVVHNNYFDAGLYNFSNLSCASSAQPYACYCLNFPPAIPDCKANNCSAAEFATFDAYELSCAAVMANPAVTIRVTCTDNDALDGNTCSSGSRTNIMLAWPVESWQNNDRVLNAECNIGRTEPHDCVTLDITL